MKKKRCAVIGAGLGGLSASIRLASLGLEVDLYEKNEKPGGKAGSLRLGGFRFDTGPTLITMPFVIEDLFRSAGERVSDYLTLEPLESQCRYFYPDGTRLDVYAEHGRLLAELAEKTGEKPEAVSSYLDYCRDIYGHTAGLFLFSDLNELSSLPLRTGLRTLFSLHKLDAMRTVHRANASFFKDPRVIQLFDRYATYNGSDPYRAPATLNIIPHVEVNLGGYVIKEGVARLAGSLADLAEKTGVRLHPGRPADRILLDGKKAAGIGSGGEEKAYDIVVSNADVHVTYRDLLGDGRTRPAKKYARLEPSSSALVFFWGIGRTFPELGIHNILFSRDYETEFDDIFAKKRCPEEPTVYITVSSKYNPADAPSGMENWFVLINTPYVQDQDWKEEVRLSRKRVLKKIGAVLGSDIEPLITCEEVLTPRNIESATRSRRGSIYGISSNSRTAAFKRQRVRSKTYKGLYFCGGSAHPGGGVPLVLLSGKICAELVNKFELKAKPWRLT